jgi:hypothetical protein
MREKVRRGLHSEILIKQNVQFQRGNLLLTQAGFREITRVESFGIFQDTSELQLHGVRISLNMIATK